MRAGEDLATEAAHEADALVEIMGVVFGPRGGGDQVVGGGLKVRQVVGGHLSCWTGSESGVKVEKGRGYIDSKRVESDEYNVLVCDHKGKVLIKMLGESCRKGQQRI